MHVRKDSNRDGSTAYGVEMKRAPVIAMIIFIIGILFNVQASGEEASPEKPYSGDFWTRSTLTGDWGGTRNNLTAKGVTFDMSLTQIGMSVVSGGKNHGWEYSGRGNITLNIDTQKLGLWPGGFFTAEIEGNYNHSINADTGALMPANSNQMYPMAGSDQLNISAVTFTQFLSRYFGAVAGKLDTTSGDMNDFAHGKGDKQFCNLAFNFNPVAVLVAPSSTLGAGVIILPTKDPEAAIITATVIDADGVANRSGFDTVFKGNSTYNVEGRVKTNLFGLTGHQLVGAAYSNKNFSSLNQTMRFQIQKLTIQEEDNSWSLYYNFDQYLYEPKKGQGIGIFGRFGVSDGNPNPAHHFYSIGVSGKGVIPGRTMDQFGIGYYYMDISNPKIIGPLTTREFLRDEYGAEAYYNIAITPWMKLTPDIQVVRPAQKNQFNIEGGILDISKKSVDTAAVVGLRLQMDF